VRTLHASFLCLLLVLLGCGGGGSGGSSAGNSQTSPTVTSISLTPSGPLALSTGATQQMSASATYSDGSTKDVTTSATWSSSSAAVASVSSGGLVTALGAGTANITATLSGVSGSAALTVAPVLKSISVTPATASLTVSQTQQFTATATYSDGSTKNLSATSTWASSTTASVTISASGLATAVAPGTSTISATVSGVQGTASVTVHGGTLSVTISGAITGAVTITGASGFSTSVTASQTLQVPPGNYTVTGNSTTNGNSRYFPAIQTQSISVPDGGSASVTVDYSTIIPNTTKVLDSAGLNSLVVSPDGSTITISSASAVASSLKDQDILAIAPSTAAPSGLLVRIISVSASSTTITASVQPAALADAIQQATFDYSQTLGPGSLTPASQKRLIRPRPSTRPRASASACLMFPYSLTLPQAPSLTLSGEDDLCATLNLSFQISLFKLQSANASLTASVNTSITLTDAASGSFSGTKDLPAFTGQTVTVLIGDVPFGLTPSLTPFIGASGSASAMVSTGVTTTTSATIGASYANGTWTPIKSTTSPTAVAATTSATANATIKGLAGVRLGLGIDQSFLPATNATVTLSPDGYLQLTAGLTSNPCWSLDGGLEGSLGITATVLDKTVANYSSGTFPLYSANVAKAKGPCYTVTVTPPNSNIDIDETVQLTAAEVDLLGNPVDATFTWSSSDDTIATVDQNGLVTGVDSGTVTITATDPNTTIAGTATVTVGTVPPEYFLAGNWAGTATVADSGSTTTYNVGASLTQTNTSITGTISVMGQDIVAVYTITGTIDGQNIKFTVAESDITAPGENPEPVGTISTNGLQVSGSDLISGATGTMTWDGKSTLTGTINGGPDEDSWNATTQINGTKLTGSATAVAGDLRDSASFTMTQQ
jgi:trimeric autotransporter adhesin